MIKSPHPALDLSFMRLRKVGGGIIYWNVETTGKYSTDYERGAILGKEFLDYIGQHPTNGNSTLLGCIVLDMEAHPAKGIKLGFMRAINEYAMGTAKILAVVDQPQSEEPDALMELISRYLRVEAEYNRHPEDDAVGLQVKQDAHTAILDEVADTKLHATSVEGVVAAIRQAIRECDDSCPHIGAALLRGALAYFDQPLAPRRGALHTLPSEAAAMGETFQPHQNGEDG